MDLDTIDRVSRVIQTNKVMVLSQKALVTSCHTL